MGMIREHIKTLLGRAKISQAELSRQAEVTQANVSDFLKSKSDVNTETADRLLSVLRRLLNMTADEWHPPPKKKYNYKPKVVPVAVPEPVVAPVVVTPSPPPEPEPVVVVEPVVDETGEVGL